MNKRIYTKLPVIKPCMAYGFQYRQTNYVNFNKNLLQYACFDTYYCSMNGHEHNIMRNGFTIPIRIIYVKACKLYQSGNKFFNSLLN